MKRPLRPDLVDAAVLEVYGLVREQAWLADRALERVLRREKRLYAGERRGVAEAVYGMLRWEGQLRWLAGMGIQTVFGAVPHVDRITPLEVLGREVIPVLSAER